jgi:alpha-1,3-glucan synthase
MTGVGYVPVEQTQLAKFASVQDSLRTWRNDVLEKLMHFSCMQIAMLDIDGWRVDKAAQTPIDIHSRWSTNQRECARRYGKENFLIVGEIVGKNAYESLFVGRGKQPDMAWTNETEAVLAMDITNSSKFVHPAGQGSLDGAAFHYPTYGAMTRFLG